MFIVLSTLLRKIVQTFQYLFQLRSFSLAFALLVSRCFSFTQLVSFRPVAFVLLIELPVFFSSSEDSPDSLSVFL
jgi:hypothetical protein